MEEIASIVFNVTTQTVTNTLRGDELRRANKTTLLMSHFYARKQFATGLPCLRGVKMSDQAIQCFILSYVYSRLLPVMNWFGEKGVDWSASSPNMKLKTLSAHSIVLSLFPNFKASVFIACNELIISEIALNSSSSITIYRPLSIISKSRLSIAIKLFYFILPCCSSTRFRRTSFFREDFRKAGAIL